MVDSTAILDMYIQLYIFGVYPSQGLTCLVYVNVQNPKISSPRRILGYLPTAIQVLNLPVYFGFIANVIRTVPLEEFQVETVQLIIDSSVCGGNPSQGTGTLEPHPKDETCQQYQDEVWNLLFCLFCLVDHLNLSHRIAIELQNLTMTHDPWRAFCMLQNVKQKKRTGRQKVNE